MWRNIEFNCRSVCIDGLYWYWDNKNYYFTKSIKKLWECYELEGSSCALPSSEEDTSSVTRAKKTEPQPPHTYRNRWLPGDCIDFFPTFCNRLQLVAMHTHDHFWLRGTCTGHTRQFITANCCIIRNACETLAARPHSNKRKLILSDGNIYSRSYWRLGVFDNQILQQKQFYYWMNQTLTKFQFDDIICSRKEDDESQFMLLQNKNHSIVIILHHGGSRVLCWIFQIHMCKRKEEPHCDNEGHRGWQRRKWY